MYKRQTLDKVIEYNPAYARIDVTTIDKIAQGCIDYETRQVSLLSFAAGIPGGIVMLGTVVADMAQYMAHKMCIRDRIWITEEEILRITITVTGKEENGK